jgi:hypothetical protein
MVFHEKARIIFLVFAFSMSGCLNTVVVDKEKAGYIAGIRFLEKHPGVVASYTVKDPGGDAFVVYFNITSSDEGQTDFAEYHVNKFTKEVFVSSKYATVLAVDQSPELESLFKRYPRAKIEGNLIKTKTPEGMKYYWEVNIIANGVNIAKFLFDAGEERLKSQSLLTSKVPQVNIDTT